MRRVSAEFAKAEAATLIDTAAHDTLTEREAKRVLAAYGIPVVDERIAESSDAAVRAAHDLGLPVVLKVESPDLPHKTEAGGVRLNLRTESEVRDACDEIIRNALRHAPRARVNGVLVQAMIPDGIEMMVGARIDPLFGALIVVSLGGIFVEAMKDSAIALAPVTHYEAHALLASLKGVAVLRGYRGRPSVDLDRLADVVQRVSELAADQSTRITELDVNPLICNAESIVAVDGLIVRRARD